MTSRARAATLAAVLVAAVVLLAAAPAAADAVAWSHLGDPRSARLASGFSTRVAESNLKQVGSLGGESWWAYDLSWNRYSYVENNPLKLVDPDGRNPTLALPIAASMLGESAVGAGVAAGAVGLEAAMPAHARTSTYLKMAVSLQVQMSKALWSSVFSENTTDSEGGGEAVAGAGSAESGERARQLGERATEGTAGEALDQLEGLEEKQDRIRKGKAEGIIESKGKSEQRLDNRLDRIETLEDALNEFD